MENYSMRKPEQRLWDRFSDNVTVPGMWLQRVENLCVVGMPDVLCLCDGRVTWIELKVAARPVRESTQLLGAKGLTVEQMNWHLDWRKSGGQSYILVADDQREMWLIPGILSDLVNKMNLSALRCSSRASTWADIAKELS
jgi:hypothetical protein